MMLKEIRTYLAAAGFGTEDEDLFYGRVPATPPDAIILLDSPGDGPIGSFCGLSEERPRGQALVRAAVFDEAVETAERLYQFLADTTEVTISGIRYSAIDVLQPPFTLYRDGNEVPYRVVNFQCTKELSVIPS